MKFETCFSAMSRNLTHSCLYRFSSVTIWLNCVNLMFLLCVSHSRSRSSSDWRRSLIDLFRPATSDCDDAVSLICMFILIGLFKKPSELLAWLCELTDFIISSVYLFCASSLASICLTRVLSQVFEFLNSFICFFTSMFSAYRSSFFIRLR